MPWAAADALRWTLSDERVGKWVSTCSILAPRPSFAQEDRIGRKKGFQFAKC